MKLDAEKIKKILLEKKYVAPEALKKAEADATRTKSDLIDLLFRNQSLNRDTLGQAIAEYYQVAYIDLNGSLPSADLVARIPEKTARRYRAILVKETDRAVIIATDEPNQEQLSATLKSLFKKKSLSIAYAVPQAIDDALDLYRKQLGTHILELIERSADAPQLLKEMIEESLAYRSSDIHLEPQEDMIKMRFRIDGVLQEIGTFPKKHYEHLLNHVKVLAHVRTDEHFAPQDGSLRHHADLKTINIRVSIIPTLDGEKIVMRILTEYVRGFSMADLGLTEIQQNLLIEASEKPFGMILVVGPTGSGKTTTLYGLLKHINSPDINITTIEDPVEYKILGVNHTQVNTATQYTFAKGLRSIVRQDPDVIFLGEIRDQESAEIGVNAALTGHLLLSTFHANDAPTAIPRLLDMGIERFLLASTLQLIIAQTLVRRICEKCKISEPIKDTALKKLTGASTLYRGKGCETCAQTGYKGRLALFEFLKNTPTMQELVVSAPSTKDIWKLARAEGTLSMFEDGIEKAKQGLTTVEEVARVATPPAQRA